MLNFSGCSSHLVNFNIDLNGLVHFRSNTIESETYYTMYFSEWLSNIHPDDVSNVEKTVFQLFTSEIPSAAITFRRKNIDNTYVNLICQCNTNNSQQITQIEIKQQAYTPHFDANLHVSHQHWISSPYHFYHYKKLLDDMLALRERKVSYTLFYLSVGKLKTLVNQHGFDILDKVYGCVFNALSDFEIYPMSRYQSILGNFVVIVGSQLDKLKIEQACNNILSHSQHSSCSSITNQCDLSIGVINQPANEECPRNILRNVARASEYALHKTKQKWAFHETSDNSKIRRHFYIERELRNAIANDDLSVIFQPIIDAKTKKTCSMEVLSRWKNSKYGEIFPDEFIPVAESQQLIEQLGWQVLIKACEFLNKLPEGSDITVNVNVSALQLQNQDFATKALDIIQHHKITPSSIVIEITESLILDNSSQASQQIITLSQLGFMLSLDDFGSGYSTLNSLFKLPINQIKLDKETAEQALQDTEAMNYVRFLVDMCQRNGVQFLVEGVETPEMSQRYIDQNVHCLQGFYFAKPMLSEDAILFIGEVTPQLELTYLD